jgi:hypothetical protein
MTIFFWMTGFSGIPPLPKLKMGIRHRRIKYLPTQLAALLFDVVRMGLVVPMGFSR